MIAGLSAVLADLRLLFGETLRLAISGALIGRNKRADRIAKALQRELIR